MHIIACTSVVRPKLLMGAREHLLGAHTKAHLSADRAKEHVLRVRTKEHLPGVRQLRCPAAVQRIVGRLIFDAFWCNE